MVFLHTLNKKLEKMMPLLTPISVIIGVALGEHLAWMAFLVPWVFAVITFTGSFSTNFTDTRHVIVHPLPLVICVLFSYLVMPLVSWGSASFLFKGDAYTITGFVLAFILPTGVMSFLWVSINQGNIPLSLAIIVVSTLIAPFAVPFGMEQILGAQISFDSWAMMKGLLWMLVIPSLIGMTLNQLTKGTVKDTLGKPLSPFSKIGLAFIVAVNSAVAAPFFREVSLKLVMIFLVAIVLSSFTYLIGWFVARLFRWDWPTTVSLTFNFGMRNISAGVVIAAAYFPPPVSIPVIIGTLFQQFLASMYTLFLRRRKPEEKVISIAPSS